MHELQRVRGSQSPQHLDDSETHATAAVDCDAGGLVDHEKSLVLDDDGFAQALEERPGNAARGTLGLEVHGRHPHLVIESEAQRRIRAAAVDPHLTLAYPTVHAASRYGAEQP